MTKRVNFSESSISKNFIFSLSLPFFDIIALNIYTRGIMKKALILFPLLLLANIDKIEYKGLIHISPITANSIININVGDEFNIEKIDKSINSLFRII